MVKKNRFVWMASFSLCAFLLWPGGLSAGTFTARTGTSGNFKILDENGSDLANASFIEIFIYRERTDLSTTASSAVVTSASGTFQTDLLSAGDYIYISSGSDAGNHEIQSVDSETQLTLTAALTTTSTNISYRYNSLVTTSYIGQGFFMENRPGEFIKSNVNLTGSFDLFIRAYNASSKASATYYGDSDLQSLTIGETQTGVTVTFTPMDDSSSLQTSNPYDPTAVELVSLAASWIDGGVVIEWITATEIDNLGFNLYRSTDPDGDFVRINVVFVPGQGTSAVGASYEYVDWGVTPGTVYFYLLEDVEYDGDTELHGPVAAVPEGSVVLPPDPDPIPGPGDSGGVSGGDGDTGGGDGDIFDEDLTEGGNVLRLEYPGLAGDPSGWTALPFEYVIAVPDCAEISIGGVKGNSRLVSVDGGAGPVPPADDILDGLMGSHSSFQGKVRGQKPVGSGLLAKIVEDGYLRGQRIVIIEVNPVQSTPVEGVYRVFEKVEIEFVFEECKESGPAPGADLLGDVSGRLGRWSSIWGARNWQGKNFKDIQWELIAGSDKVVKAGVDRDGICRVSISDLRDMGLSFKKLRVLHLGQEIPVEFVPSGNEKSHPGLWGKVFQKWSKSDGEIRFLAQTPDSRYTGNSVYWLVPSLFAGTEMPEISGRPDGALATVDRLPVRVKRETNRYYYANMPGGEDADRWYWDYLVAGQPKNFALGLAGPVAGGDGLLTLAVIGLLDDPGIPEEHHLKVRLNGVEIGDVRWGGRGEVLSTHLIPEGIISPSVNTLGLELIGDTGASGNVVLLNAVEVTYTRMLSGSSGEIRFQVEGPVNIEVPGFPGEEVQVYRAGPSAEQARLVDVEMNVSGVGTTVRFRADGGEYLVVSDDLVPAPESLELNQPSDLTSSGNGADVIVIGPSQFRTGLLPLLAARVREGLRADFVDVEDVYDEFHYGELDPRAIRDFLRFAYQNWLPPAPAFILLAGDASYDFKDYLGTGNTGLIPAPQVTTDYLGFTGPSDSWYACIDGDDEVPDLAIGRLPVRTVEELNEAVDKILTYGRSILSNNRVLLAADDDEPIFVGGLEEVAANVLDGFDITRAYLGVLGLQDTRERILETLLSGVGIFEYAGHSGVTAFAREDIFNVNDLPALSGNGAPFLAVGLGCLSAYFDVPTLESLGEELIRVPQGGAVAGLFSSGFTYPEEQMQLNRSFIQSIVEGDRLGVGFLKAQLDVAGQGRFRDILRTYHLFGDPSLSFSRE